MKISFFVFVGILFNVLSFPSLSAQASSSFAYKAQCGVRGYGDNDWVGPAGSIADLKMLCDLSKLPEYRDRTFLYNIKTETTN
jgi:hypothetical protein